MTTSNTPFPAERLYLDAVLVFLKSVVDDTLDDSKRHGGMCPEIEEVIFEAMPEEITPDEQDTEAVAAFLAKGIKWPNGREVREFVVGLMSGWPKHSGNRDYPVPAPKTFKAGLGPMEETPRAEVYYDLCDGPLQFYRGEYGDNRRNLAAYLIEQLKDLPCLNDPTTPAS